MIRIANVSKTYFTSNGPKQVIKHASFEIERGQIVGILGKNGAGKSTLVRLLSGAEKPTAGQIDRGMRVSWPLAFGGGFQGSLTGRDNVKFICRVYGVKPEAVMEFVNDFAELGKDFKEPIKYYSTGMASRLAFALSMAIDFDCYLIDEIIAVGDSRFHQKCTDALFVKRQHKAKIIVSHQEAIIRAYCSKAAVIQDGYVKIYPNIDDAISSYTSMN